MPLWYIRWRLGKQLGAWDSAPRRALRNQISPVGGRVLEVACGPGIEYEGLRRAGLNVDYTGVDVTPRMVSVCASRFPQAKFLVGDVEHLPFPDASFDVVFTKDLFEHLPGFETGLSEMYRVAKRLVLVHFFLPLVEGATVYGFHPESAFRYNRYSKPDVVRFAFSLGTASVEVIPIQSGTGVSHLLRLGKAD